MDTWNDLFAEQENRISIQYQNTKTKYTHWFWNMNTRTRAHNDLMIYAINKWKVMHVEFTIGFCYVCFIYPCSFLLLYEIWRSKIMTVHRFWGLRFQKVSINSYKSIFERDIMPHVVEQTKKMIFQSIESWDMCKRKFSFRFESVCMIGESVWMLRKRQLMSIT